MTRRFELHSFLLLCLTAAACFPAHGQSSTSYLNDTGSPAYSLQIPVENGFIDVSNGNLHLEFPLASHPQRGALVLNERLAYDSRIWMFSPFGSHGSYHWWPYNVSGPNNGLATPQTSGGWRFITGAEIGTVSFTVTSQTTNSCGNPNNGDPQPVMGRGGPSGNTYQSTSSITWTDPSGTEHPFQASHSSFSDDCDPTQDTSSVSGGNATDGSGYSIPSDPNGNVRIIDNTGTQVYPNIVDRYGNFWSADGQGNLIDDTGRTPVISTQNGNTYTYDVLAPNGPIQNNGTRIRYTVTLSPVPISTYFQPFSQSDIYPWNPSYNYLTPVQSIILPDGSSYTFTYDTNGEVSRVTLPTGGVIQYGYTDFVDSAQTENNWLTSRTLGSNPAMTFTPQVGTTCANYSTGCREYVVLHKPSGDESVYELTLANGAWNTGEAVLTGSIPQAVNIASFIHQPPSNPNLIAQTNVTNQYSNACWGSNCAGANYLTGSTKLTTLFASGKPSVSTQAQTTYDPVSGKQTGSMVWDYFPASQSASSLNPASETHYYYTGYDLTFVGSSSPGTGQVSSTTYAFTPNAVATSGLPQHGSQNAGGPYLASVSRWINSGGGSSSTTSSTMDDSGTVLTVSDANGNPPTQISHQCFNSLPLAVTDPLGHTSVQSYDCSSGALLNSRDANDAAASRSGTVYNYDQTGRLQTVSTPDGGVVTTTYVSANEVDTTVNAATPIQSRSIIDSYGRPLSSIVGGVESDTSYDSNGRASCTTNPYISSSPAKSCVTAYDGLDRPLSQLLQDGSTRSYSYSANTSTLTDEKGASWARTSDAFGHLTSVSEPGPSGNLLTSYSYDGLGNLATVTQNGNPALADIPRTRTFTYDSLSRLVCESHPESAQAGSTQPNCPASATTATPQGAVGFTYYPGGQLRTKTDARGTTTTFSYDSLNRPTLKQYSDGTLPAAFGYDGYSVDHSQIVSPTNTIGRMSSMSNLGQASVTLSGAYFGYDPAGRLQWERVASPSDGSYQSSFTALYDSAGQMTDLYYPDGKHVTQTWDNAGRLQTVGNDASKQAYLAQQVYNPDALTTTMTLGNGITQTMASNSRLQVQSIVTAATGQSLAGQTLLSHSYCYANCATGGTANSGTIWGITDTLNPSRSQGYTYDPLNRITGFTWVVHRISSMHWTLSAISRAWSMGSLRRRSTRRTEL